MKYFTLLGGIAGFALTFPTSLAAGADAGTAVRDAMFGCLIGGGLLRSFRYVMLQHIRQVITEKARTRDTAGAAEGTTGAVAA